MKRYSIGIFEEWLDDEINELTLILETLPNEEEAQKKTELKAKLDTLKEVQIELNKGTSYE